MKAPFPYYGGKSRQAAEVWSRLGDPTVYVEPFAGSLAVLLARDAPGQREIVCDLNGYISNFWRALREDPEAVAYWADYPTFHHDLTDRHRWLVAWGRENREQIRDADWYDVKAAGWWVWGISNWIGSGWCEDKGDVEGQIKLHDKIPHVHSMPGGQGVQLQKKNLPMVHDKIPMMKDAQGVQVQRKTFTGDIGTGERLSDWFHALAQRLSRVIVLNRNWTSALTPTILMHTKTSPKPPVGILLDPPYLREQRSNADLYHSDSSDSTCLLYTSPSPRDRQKSRMPSSA